MRKCVIGRVGDGTFQEAWRSLEGGSWRGTLFVHGGLVNGGPMEKTIHFAETFALVLNFQPPSQTLPPTEPIEVILHWGDDGPGSSTTAPGHDSLEGSEDSQAEAKSSIDDPAYLEAARRYLRTELSEVLSWEGALFELREGPIPQAMLAGEKCLKIRVSPAPLIKGLKPPPASVPCGTPSLLPADPLARIEELQRRLPNAFAWHLITWEQARTWKELGSLHRAIFCWRDLAQHYLDWGAPENACSVLEEALQMCPAHFGIGEELISLHQSSGRVKQAEKVAETL